MDKARRPTFRFPWFRILGWAGLIGATVLLVRAEARRDAPLEGVAFHGDLSYRRVDGRPLRLDVYLPAERPARGARPAVIALHGGGWRGGSKADMRPLAVPLARHGYAVFAVDYRLAKPAVPSWPENLDDARAAVRWVRAHAAEYGVDPSRIAALGISAGGHLAALLGTDPVEGARVAAVVDFYGPADLRALEHPDAPARGAVNLLLGATGSDLARRAADASPVHHVSSDDPPMLLIHGSDDRLVPLVQSERLAAALDGQGVVHRLLIVPGARHGFGYAVEGRNLLPDVLEFLAHADR